MKLSMLHVCILHILVDWVLYNNFYTSCNPHISLTPALYSHFPKWLQVAMSTTPSRTLLSTHAPKTRGKSTPHRTISTNIYFTHDTFTNSAIKRLSTSHGLPHSRGWREQATNRLLFPIYSLKPQYGNCSISNKFSMRFNNRKFFVV